MKRGIVMWTDAYDAARLPMKSTVTSSIDGWKPDGVWYAPGDEWIAWCSKEHPRWVTRHVYTILFDDARLLVIRTLAELAGFHGNFAAVGPGFRSHVQLIDWTRVAARYDGIEIAPFQDDAAHELDWYRSWDTASGCLWNRAAIVGVEPAAVHPACESP